MSADCAGHAGCLNDASQGGQVDRHVHREVAPANLSVDLQLSTAQGGQVRGCAAQRCGMTEGALHSACGLQTNECLHRVPRCRIASWGRLPLFNPLQGLKLVTGVWAQGTHPCEVPKFIARCEGGQAQLVKYLNVSFVWRLPRRLAISRFWRLLAVFGLLGEKSLLKKC